MRCLPCLPTIVLAALSSCSRPLPEPRVGDGHLWHAETYESAPAIRWPNWAWGRSFREFELPEARNAPLEVDRPPRFKNPRPLIVNITSDGGIEMKGEYIELWERQPNQLRASLARHAGVPDARTTGHTVATPLVINADRRRGWWLAGRVLEIAVHELGFRDVQISVLDSAHRDAREALWTVVPVQGPAEHALVARLESPPPPEDDLQLRSVHLHVGDRTWEFPPHDRFSRAEFFREANRIWRDVESHVSRRERAASILHVDSPDVPHGFVVAILDLLQGAGVATVDLPESLLRWTPRERPEPPEPRVPHGPPSLWTWAIGVLAALLAFAVTWGPLRGVGRRT